MAKLSNTRVTGVVTQTQAASDGQHLVRLGELNALLATKKAASYAPASSEVTGLAGAIDTEIESFIVASNTVTWGDAGGGKWKGSVRLKTNGALGADSEGLYVMLGSGSNQAAPGNHTHPEFNAPVTVADSRSIDFVLTGQQVSGDIILVETGGLRLTDSGVQADFGTSYNQIPRGNHSHAGLELAHPAVTVTSSGSVRLTLSGQALQADAILVTGGGLQLTASGLAVVFGTTAGTVAAGNHTHAQLHDALTVVSTSSLNLFLDGQQESGVVRLDPNPASGGGKIGVGPDGLFVELGTASNVAAAGDHTHDTATSDAAGLMSPEQAAQLAAVTVNIGGTIAAMINAIDTVVTFARGDILLPGMYVGGRVRWSQAMEIMGMNLTAMASSGTQTLALEVAGTVLAQTIIIPSGVENTEVYAEKTLGGVFVTVPAGKSFSDYVRLKCTAGPGLVQACASVVNVCLNVRPAVKAGLVPPGFAP